MQSPFYKNRDLKTSGKDKPIQSRIAPEVKKDLKDYFMKRYNTTEGVSSSFIHELIVNFLNSILLEKKSFEDIYVIMLLPKTQDPDELEIKGTIIGAVETQDGEPMRRVFRRKHYHKNKFNFIYNLEDFNELTFNMLHFERLNVPAFFCVSEDIQHDFVKTKMRLSEVYHDIDLDECYITIFNINNYLDELIEGQYMSTHYQYYHEGILVFSNLLDEIRVCTTLDWSFVNGEIVIQLNIVDRGEFSETIIYNTNNEDIVDEYYSITKTITREEALKKRKEEALHNIAYFNERVKYYDEELAKIEKK